MNGSSFFWKVFGGTVAVVLITAFIVYLSALSGVERRVASATEERVTQETQLVAELASLAWSQETGAFELKSVQMASSALEGSRVTLIDASGVVVFDSHESPQSMDNHLGRSEVRELGRVLTRYSRTLGKEMTYCAAAVHANGELIGFARVAISTADREARIAGLRGAIRNGALLAGLVSLLLAGFFARRVTRPLSQIASLVDEVGKGETARRLRVESRDEVGQLAAAVNQMADELSLKIGRIERDRAEREAILSAMTDGLLAMDLETRVLFINRPARVLLDVSDGPVKGILVRELCRNSPLNELVGRSVQSAETLHAHAPFASAEGERDVDLSAVPLAGTGGGRRGSVVVLRDVTELKHLEAVRRDFVSNVSHELKTPLTAMRGFVEAVLEDEEMPREQRLSFLGKAQRNTERLSAIVTDLLSLSRLESEERELSMESIALEDLIHEALDDLSDLADSRRVQVDVIVPGVALRAVVDSQAMSLALTNLIANALRYSPEGASVTVRAQAEGADAVIEVIDNGPGIAEHEQERIFERFYRIDKARSRTLGGTGLGLAIVRHVMAAQGGRVELQSELGKGSTFRLILPRETV